jgi:HD-like signal output (HDOD) protein
MSAAKSNTAAAPEAPDVTFAFVQALAGELSGDDDVDIAKVVTAIGSEPAIASQIVRMANSAALNPRRIPAADLRAAITRVGLNTVRTSTVAFAVTQLRVAPDFQGLERQIEDLWQRSVRVASLSQAIARRLTQLNADAAMLAGLLQGIGRLYILARASKHEALFADQQAYNHVVQTWHLQIAAALIENWGFAPDIIEGVRNSEDMDQDIRGPLTLADVLAVAALLADYAGTPETLKALVAASRPFQRLQLDFEACENFMTSTAEEVAQLREVLSV